MQVPYTTLSELPTHCDDLYQMIKRDEIVLSNVVPGPFLDAFQKSSGIERNMAQYFWAQWVHGGNILLHEGIRERQGLLTMLLCLRLRVNSAHDWGGILRHVVPFMGALNDHEIQIHMRVPRPAGDNLKLFVPTMLAASRESGRATGRYSTWGTSYRVPPACLPELRAAWQRAAELARSVYLEFLTHEAQLPAGTRDFVDLVDVVLHVYHEPASALVHGSRLGRLAQDLIRGCGRENAIRLVTRAAGA